jgi:hypothetical protein
VVLMDVISHNVILKLNSYNLQVSFLDLCACFHMCGFVNFDSVGCQSSSAKQNILRNIFPRTKFEQYN